MNLLNSINTPAITMNFLYVSIAPTRNNYGIKYSLPDRKICTFCHPERFTKKYLLLNKIYFEKG